MKRIMIGMAIVIAASVMVGCAALDRGYDTEVTWTDTPVVKVTTNTVVATNVVSQVVERPSVVLVTNDVTGAVSGYVTREPVATNLVTLLVTNTIPVFETNIVQVPVTNLVAKPAALATIKATGGVVNTFLPGVGSLVALLLGGFYHGYRRKGSSVQIVERLAQLIRARGAGDVMPHHAAKAMCLHRRHLLK